MDLLIAKILFPKESLFPLYYLLEESCNIPIIGQMVHASFRNKEIIGFIWEIVEAKNIEYNLNKLKTLHKKNIFDYILCKKHLIFLNRLSTYYVSPLGSILKLSIPFDIKDLLFSDKYASKPITPSIEKIINDNNLFKLSQEQEKIFNGIKNLTNKKPTVIKGITGSGKTEIYFHLIWEKILLKKQSLILVPEIGLVSDISERFISRFKFKPVIWTSKVSIKKKNIYLRQIILGQSLVVIGTRSSLFLPYKNLSLIIVDEEHSSSYKQESGVLYNARDASVLKGLIQDIQVILVSATPSIETIYNSTISKYNFFSLKLRFNQASLPSIEILDMKKEVFKHKSWISSKLIFYIKKNIEKKEQTILFLNRKGYAHIIICSSCGYRLECRFCSVSLVLYKTKKLLKCQYCGYIQKILTKCSHCSKEGSLIALGVGIDQVSEEIKKIFPDQKIFSLSTDLSSQKVVDTLQLMKEDKIDILIGTQIISKGFHFPNLTFIGIIDAGIIGYREDYRAHERMYQLLNQIIGRAGREKKLGHVLIQSYNPSNKTITAIKNYDEDQFIKNELNQRKLSNMPPFTRSCVVSFIGKSKEKIFQLSKNFIYEISNLLPNKNDIVILGPVERAVFKIAGKYSYKLLILSPRNINIQKYLKSCYDSFKGNGTFSIRVDVDPQYLV